MTDLASLVLAIDSTSVKTGVASLDGLTAAGERAEGAAKGVAAGANSAGAAASRMAAEAQGASRAASQMSGGMLSLGSSTQNAQIVMLETTHIARNLGAQLAAGVDPIRALTMESGRFLTLLQYGGSSLGGMIKNLAEFTGIIRVTRDAELAEEAANALAAATAVKSAAQRAAANVVAADTEVALAEASVRTAATSQAEAAAQARLASAMEAVTAAAAEATIAEDALAASAAAAGAAQEASAATTTTALGPVAIALGLVAVAAAAVYAAFNDVSDASGTSKQAMDDLANATKNEKAAADDLKQAIDRLYSSTLKEGQSAYAAANASITVAEAYRTRATEARKAAIAELELAKSKAGAANATANAGGGPSYATAFAVGAAAKAEAQVRELDAQINGLNAEIGKTDSAIRLQLGKIAGMRINEQFDASAAAVGKFSRAQDDLNKKLGAGTISLSEYARELRGAKETELAEQEAAKASAGAHRATAAAHHASAKAAKEETDALTKLLARFDEFKDMAIDKDLLKQGSLFKDDKSLEDAMAKLPDYGKQLLESLRAIGDQAAITGQALSDAFGKPGDVLAGLLSGLADYHIEQQRVSQAVTEGTMDQATADRELANLRAHNIGQALSGLKSLFSEHSAIYKAMTAVEKVYAVLQLANTIRAIAADSAYTASSVAKSGIRAVANGVEAFAKTLASLPFPFNIAAGAAVVALLAGVGISIGGGGSSSQTAPTSADDLQKAAGTGTVLGDSAAKSASIANSLEIMSKNSTKALDYSDAMVRALRNIESGIGDLTAAIARQLQLQGGFFDTTGKLGTSSSGIQGLFGSTTTKSLYDQGITLNSANIGQILETGISGATYQVIEKVKKNSGFLGIGGSTKTSYQTTTGALDSDITSQMNAIIGQLYNSVVAAAKVLGLDVADALKTFQVEIGKISFKDLTGQQITDELNAVFSKIGDQMAGFAVSGLAQFQKAGEGLFETLMRLAKDYLTIDAALKSIGMTFGSVGASSIAARESLIDLAGGLDTFVSQVNFFYDHFLTNGQKLAMEQSEVDAAFAQMGVAAPKSIDAFTSLVQGLNLSTDAGQQMFEALMQIAPAFYDVATAADALAKKQADLQVQLLQAQGDTAGATALQRSIALAAIDPSLQELQKQIWATQDAASAAVAALKLENDRQNLQVQLLQAQGKTQQATDLQRKIALAALDPALRDLQKQVWKAQDATAAQAAAAEKLATAKDNLLQAYKREADALQQTIDKFSKFATDLKAFRDSLFIGTDGQQSYSAALVELMKQAGLANAGDENALGGGLQDSAQKFIDAATANAHTLQDVERAKALVAGYLDQAIGGASGHATAAEQQLAQLKTQVGKLVNINDSVLTVADAIKQLTALMFPSRTPAHRPQSSAGQAPTTHEKTTHDKLDRIHAAMEAVASHAAKTARVLDRADRGGSIAFVTDADSPIKVFS